MSDIIDIEFHWLYMSKTLDIRSGEIDMNFHEKSNMAMLAIMIVVYGIYFGQALLSIVSAGVPPAEALAATNALMVVTVGAVTVLAIIAHIIIAVLAPSEADDARDERDKLMENIHDAIQHSREYDLPLESIELNDMEWKLFTDDRSMQLLYPTYETLTQHWCMYMGVLIYREGHRPKEKM